ncbi:T9SS type A sorting domain-containing protein [Flavobacterium sp. SM15]|uniref:DUF7619 domain-containing protein n=1 Tax=Flavobacterium sp. SM15 TaxID=2908005 RepID=UPI001EDA7A64|nr:T9SS type A sorting domain-containing protein [Flavobacterium sp. SM15]MCG2611387.1 T9SS type A sorting domain-containing protein [Flavobacterium sp. SM15]
MRNLYFFLFFLLFSFGHAQNPADVDPSFNFAAIPSNNYYLDGSGIGKIQINSSGRMIMLHSDDHYFNTSNIRIKKLVVLNNNFLESELSSRMNGEVLDFVLQPDNKVVVVGKFTSYDGISKNRIVRLNSDYTIDESFVIGAGFNSGYVSKADLLSNGNIVLQGSGISNYNGTPVSRFITLNSTGGLVNTFNVPSNFNVRAVQNDGKVVGVDYYAGLIRINTDGTQDLTFTAGTTESNNTIENAFIQPDGSIIVTGDFTTFNSISKRSMVRVLSNGQLDTSFVGHTGTNDLNIIDVKFQPDNKILVYGGFNQYSGVNCKRIIRLNPDGSRDTSFTLQNDFNDVYFNGTDRKLLIQNDGKVLLYNNSSIGLAYNNSYYNGLIRFNSDGTRDNSLNFVTKGADRKIKAAYQQPDGKIIVSGALATYNGIEKKGVARLNSDGSLDASFSVTQNQWFYDDEYVVKGLSDGKFLCYVDGGLQNRISVMNANGTQFSSTVPGYAGSFNNSISTVEVNGNDLYFAGDFTTFNNISCGKIAKVNSGLNSLNSSFNCPQNIGISNITQMQIDATGRVYAMGYSTGPERIVRLNTNGSFDRIIYNMSGLARIKNFLVQPDGKILIYFLDAINNGNTIVYKVIRVDETGVLDNSFNAYTLSENGLRNGDDIATLKLLPDGKILFSADYVLSDKNYSKLFRLNANGVPDSTFDNSKVYNDRIKCIALMNSGGILVGGYFRTVDNYQSGGIVKLKGENYYFAQGENKLDYNINGCDSSDFSFSNLKFNIASGSGNNAVISNITGNYLIGVTSGNYTITPVLENPNYFTASPSSITVDFPTQASPLAQNFCITPNGIHSDLEVSMIPIAPARPGFDVKYKLVYKNKGNQVQSGSVVLTFNDAVLDVVSSVPAASNQSVNTRSWDFTNLNPYETREIVVTFNLNTPTETPSLNGGDVLNYSATISSAQTDETPNDNTFALNQTVVNSYDPNDKTCLQGTTVGTNKVGDYVHYVIRFENTGTYNAQNITVTDFIDTSKFDVSTLIPVSGSHLFTTKISQGNKVEFVFDNINLPFADATNDGYVAFKIKTKPTLVSGDTFTNGASIYFDYNYPIVTNTYSTTIQALNVQDFSFGTYFSLYPNPVAEVLNVSKKSDIELQSLEIYNSLGQIVLAVPNAKEVSTIDVSNLTSGTYFVKINSDKGSAITKFIKK